MPLPYNSATTFFGVYLREVKTYIYTKFCTSMFIVLFFNWFEREQWERERYILFHLLMYSLIDSCMCPDQGWKPHPYESWRCSNHLGDPAGAEVSVLVTLKIETSGAKGRELGFIQRDRRIGCNFLQPYGNTEGPHMCAEWRGVDLSEPRAAGLF